MHESNVPLQDVWTPLQNPSDWQRLTDDPFKRNPSSQLKVTSFGKVVQRPVKEPFEGTGKEPQSLAVGKKAIIGCNKLIAKNSDSLTLWLIENWKCIGKSYLCRCHPDRNKFNTHNAQGDFLTTRRVITWSQPQKSFVLNAYILWTLVELAPVYFVVTFTKA